MSAATDKLRDEIASHYADAFFGHPGAPSDPDDREALAEFIADALDRYAAAIRADEPEPAEGFTAWVTRDRGSDAAEVWTVEPPTYSGATWVARYSTSRVAPLSIRDSDALLGDARGAGAIRRVRIVPDGSVGDE